MNNGIDQSKITRAAISLRAAEKKPGVKVNLDARRWRAAGIARTCGLPVQAVGEEGDPNHLVEAIISATDQLAGATS